MSLLKYINRFQRMHDLITREATGSCEEFAHKLGISKSMLMIDLAELREVGAEFEFCLIKKSYRFTKPFTLIIGREKRQIIGGENFYQFYASPIALDWQLLTLHCQDY